MPAKASTRSAVKPAGPVTHAPRPSGGSSSARSDSTVSPTSPEMGTNTSIASPSSDSIGGLTSAPIPSIVASESTNDCAYSRSASVSPPSRANTTIAGMLSPPANSGSSWETWVASELAGR